MAGTGRRNSGNQRRYPGKYSHSFPTIDYGWYYKVWNSQYCIYISYKGSTSEISINKWKNMAAVSRGTAATARWVLPKLRMGSDFTRYG